MSTRLQRAFRDLSIQRKLTFIITMTSALSLVLACAGFVLNDVLTFRRVTRETTATLATVVANNSAAALTFGDADTARESLSTLKDEPHVVAAALYKDGRPFATYVRSGAADTLPTVAPPASQRSFGGGALTLAQPVIVDGGRVGVLYLIRDVRDLDDRLKRYVAIAGALLLAATLVAFGFSSAFQRVISRPLSQLAQTARRVSQAKDYSVRAAGDSRDEIGQLIAVFNEMLAQIQQRDAALLTAHGALERRVRERTAQLEQEIGERRAAEKALQQQLTRISLLNQITTAMSDRQDLDRIVRVVLAELERHLPVDFGSVSLFDAGSEMLTVAAARRRGTSRGVDTLAPAGAFAAALQGLDGCRNGQHVYLPDTAAVAAPLPSRFAAARLRSAVAVPLIVEHRLFGLLLVARETTEAFTSGECEFLRMLGEQVAAAGSQARLYSELQRAYAELRQSQRAMMQQERLRALGQMASGIAHDVNNSLTPVVTFTDILLAQGDGLSEKARRYLNHIRTAGADIGTIVSRLREFYRPRDNDEPHLPVELHAVLRQVAELTRPRWRDMPQARGSVITLQTDFAADLELIAGNESELRESFINLVLNAVDAMPQGGQLTFRTRMKKSATGRPDEVVVEIADTGTGMDEETRSRCLEPFFSTKGQLGTGLGLAMVYGVLQRHSGLIEIESAPGAGTTMRLIFPPRATAGADAANLERVEVAGPRRILCVDDEPMLRTVLEELFRLDGHEVEVAPNGDDGIKALRNAGAKGTPFDLVVTDLGMPHIDGRQFAQAVKREWPQMPVVLLTGWGKIMKAEGDEPEVFDGILTKPPRLKDLREVLSKVLGPNRNPETLRS